MRAFLWFLVLICLGLAAMATLAYPAWTLLNPYLDVPFHRLANRTGQLVLLVGLLTMIRRLALADRASLGYALPAPRFLRAAAVGLAIGVATMLPVMLMMVALDLRVLRPGVTLEAATWASLALQGAVSGVVVALIEETFLRGAMYTGIARESGKFAAILLTSLLYAAFHFIGKARIPVDQLGPGSGLRLIAESFAAFGRPLDVADAFLSLFAVGVLLSLVRSLTGNIAACIGLHAGWVWMITFMRETSARDDSAPLSFLLSRFDGVVGWMVLGWTLLIGVAIHRLYRPAAAETATARSAV